MYLKSKNPGSIVIIIALGLFVCTPVHAKEMYDAGQPMSLLRSPIWSLSGSVGGAGVAFTDDPVPIYNPALIGEVKQLSISMGHSQVYFNDNRLNEIYVTSPIATLLQQRHPTVSWFPDYFGVSIINNKVSGIERRGDLGTPLGRYSVITTAFMPTIVYNVFSEKIRFGITYKYYSTDVGGIQTDKIETVDAGLLVRDISPLFFKRFFKKIGLDKLDYGVSYRDITNVFTNNKGRVAKIPATISFGSALTWKLLENWRKERPKWKYFFPRLKILSQMDITDNMRDRNSFGGQLTVYENKRKDIVLTGRLGYRYPNDRVFGGLGFAKGDVGLDITYAQNDIDKKYNPFELWKVYFSYKPGMSPGWNYYHELMDNAVRQKRMNDILEARKLYNEAYELKGTDDAIEQRQIMDNIIEQDRDIVKKLQRYYNAAKDEYDRSFEANQGKKSLLSTAILYCNKVVLFPEEPMDNLYKDTSANIKIQAEVLMLDAGNRKNELMALTKDSGDTGYAIKLVGILENKIYEMYEALSLGDEPQAYHIVNSISGTLLELDLNKLPPAQVKEATEMLLDLQKIMKLVDIGQKFTEQLDGFLKSYQRVH